MGSKNTVIEKEKVSYDGIFDLKELYTHLHDWLTWRKYDVAEKKYKEKVTQGGKDIDVEWEAKRSADEYSDFVISIKANAKGINDVEVQKDASKVKMQKGSVDFEISATLITDKNDVWEARPSFKFLQKFYERYLYKNDLDRLQGELDKHGRGLLNEIKAFLNLYQF